MIKLLKCVVFFILFLNVKTCYSSECFLDFSHIIKEVELLDTMIRKKSRNMNYVFVVDIKYISQEQIKYEILPVSSLGSFLDFNIGFEMNLNNNKRIFITRNIYTYDFFKSKKHKLIHKFIRNWSIRDVTIENLFKVYDYLSLNNTVTTISNDYEHKMLLEYSPYRSMPFKSIYIDQLNKLNIDLSYELNKKK